VADFGIALAVSAAGGNRLTETGLSLGTPAYMSPEQATADRELDARSDIYSLGCIAYEMLTGEPPHAGPTTQAVITKLVTEEPRPVSALRRNVPPEVEAAVHQALEKLPADRFATAAQFSDALSGPTSLPTASRRMVAAAVSKPTRPAFTLVVPWALAAVASAAAVWQATRGGQPSVPAAPIRFDATPVEVQVMAPIGPVVVLSPDGRTMVYVARDSLGAVMLHQRSLGELKGRPIPGTEHANLPAFSPNGEWLAFHADGKLRKIRLSGGLPESIADLPGDARGVSWGDGDRIVFSPSSASGLFEVPAKGGTVTELTRPDSARGEIGHRWPLVLPGGRFVVFNPWKGSVSNPELAILSLETREIRTLTAGTNAQYANGLLMFGMPGEKAGRIGVAPFDLEKGVLTGEARLLDDAVDVGAGGAVQLTVSGTGTAVTAVGLRRDLTFSLIDEAGNDEVLFEVPAGDYHDLRFSPDGGRVALTIGGTTGHDLWVRDLARGTSTRVTFGGENQGPVWTPDGRWLAYTAQEGGRPWARVTSAQGIGTPRNLTADDVGTVVALGPGGRSVLTDRSNRSNTDVMLVPIDGGAPRILLAGPFREAFPAASPDGKWIAYASDESGRNEVFVTDSATAERWQISTDGGTEPAWSPDGRVLYYRAEIGVLAVPIEPGDPFRFGSPRRRTGLFGASASSASMRQYDPHPRRNALLVTRTPPNESRITVTVHWVDEVKRLLAGGK
jgi:serine/threonine-protein kinase